MNEPVETLTHDGYVISIYRDEDARNPREEFDHLGTLHVRGPRCVAIDNNSSPWCTDTDDGIAIPLSINYHDGTLGECSDDMADGYIYVTRDKILSEYGAKRISAKTRAHVIKVLEAELKEYNAYVTGDVFGYVIYDDAGNELDSCWGFYGIDYCIESAKQSVPDDSRIGTYVI